MMAHWSFYMFQQIRDHSVSEKETITCGLYPREHIEGIENTWEIHSQIYSWFSTHFVSIYIKIPQEVTREDLEELSSGYLKLRIGEYIRACELKRCRVVVLMKTVNYFINALTFGFYSSEVRSSIVYESGKGINESPTFFGDVTGTFYHT